MFDLAWSELALIGAVAVMVLGPKELPGAMRTMAKVMRKMRNLSSELQGHINEVVREAELDEVRQSIQKLSTTNLTAEVTKAIDPTGELSSALDPNTMSNAASDSAASDSTVASSTSQTAVTEIAAPEAVSENAAPSAPSPPSSSATPT